jgi:hypothetical protein
VANSNRDIQRKNHRFTAETRDMLIKAGVAQDMLRAFQGQPLPVRNAAGKVVGESEVPALSDRIAIGKILLGKIMPDLRSVEVDANIEGGGQIILQLAPGIAPPGALRDVTPAPAQIDDATPIATLAQSPVETDHTPEAADDAPEPAPTRPRRRRRTDK